MRFVIAGPSRAARTASAFFHSRLPLVILPAVTLLLLASVPVAAFSAGQTGVTVRPATPGVEASSTSILAVALQSLGTFQGECFPWVRRVVQQATGRLIGFDYREGYLEAGAVEVPLDQAGPGDVIQLIDDADTSAGADYPGMHTTIVVQASGGGVFRVIDSNVDFSGVVQIREDYNPMAMAGRYPNINVHVYRFPGQSSTTVAAPTPAPVPSNQLIAYTPTQGSGGTAVPQQAGSTAVVRADGECLRLRSAPSTTATVLTCLPDGSTVTLLAGRQEVEGITWQAVTAAGRSGWVAAQYLGAASAPPPPTAGATPPAAVSTPPPSSAGTSDGAIIGDLPRAGGLALVVFGGGTTDTLIGSVSSRGCTMVSVWTNRNGGGLVGMIPGAPALVNREWTSQFPTGTLEPRTPLIVVCRGATAPSDAPPPTSPGSGSGGAPGSGPPGPAGNE